MQHYLKQLLSDVEAATKNVSFPFIEKELSLHDWISEEDEEANAPARNLCEWTGIAQDALPPAAMLSEKQVQKLLEALKQMLSVYNCHFVLQIEVPEEIQYEAIRQNFDQQVKIKQWHMGFFELCKRGTLAKTCALGDYCQCGFFKEFFEGYVDEELTPEEERASALAIEVQHIKKKYGDDWIKYYPYHLDKEYDDENGNPYDYGFPEDDEDDREGDEWWRR
jgi:hypothetical protein